MIEVLDKRQTKVPSFDEIKPDLEAEQAQTIVDTFIDSIKKEAKIQLFDLPKAEEKDTNLKTKESDNSTIEKTDPKEKEDTQKEDA